MRPLSTRTVMFHSERLSSNDDRLRILFKEGLR